MRKVLVLGLIAAMAVLGVPAGAAAGVAQKGGSVSGKAEGADKAPLKNYTVRVRNVNTSAVAGSTQSGAAGEFSFASLAPGDYVIEVVDATGKVVGVSAPIAIAEGASVTITVNASVASALTTASHGGFSLFGLGQVASYTVLTAAGAAAVTGVIAAQKDASPSR